MYCRRIMGAVDKNHKPIPGSSLPDDHMVKISFFPDFLDMMPLLFGSSRNAFEGFAFRQQHIEDIAIGHPGQLQFHLDHGHGTAFFCNIY